MFYFIGIKGSGMATLANILHDLGNQVSGYDDAYDDKKPDIVIDVPGGA